MILTVIMDRISKVFTVLSSLMKVYIFLRHDKIFINVMLVLQNSSDSQHFLPGLPSDTLSDCAHHIGNLKFEEDLVMQNEEGVCVKTENGICSEEEVEEKDICTKEEEDIDIKEEVS
jgi:hypothetical protein